MAKKSTLEADVEEAARAEEVQGYEQKIAVLRNEVSGIRRDNKLLHSKNDELQSTLDLVQQIESKHTKPAPWSSPKKTSKSHVGVINLLLSDLHLDEVVDPKEIEHLNAYDRAIAEARLRRCVEKTIMLSRDYISGVKYEGMSLMLGGDMISGWIHEELSETNEAPVPETVDYWLDPLSAAIGSFVEEYGKVHVSGVVGNHGRVTKKPRAKKRVTDNIDWLIYRMLMRDFKNDDRVTWQLPYSSDCLVQTYDTKVLMTHGDQFRGGSGIAGLLSPMMIGVHRKSKRAMQTDTNFDYLVMGHWHQLSFFKNVMVNGSLKGYDEYAYVSNFDYEPAQQALWLTTPENGITFQAPVLVEDREKEGW